MAKTVFRPLDGILLLDKPAGYSSNQALQDVRRLFRAEKGGHTGALDPLATGLLPLCFGETTKIAGLLLGGRAEEEVETVGECLPAGAVHVGMYSYGEIAPPSRGSRSQLHNQTMTVTVLGEA